MNKNFKNYAYMSFAMALAMTMASCSDDDNKVEIQETDAAYVGKEVGNFTADEWYPAANPKPPSPPQKKVKVRIKTVLPQNEPWQHCIAVIM